jgi:hypothetical protein
LTEDHETRAEFGGALVTVVVLAIIGAVLVGIWIGFWAAMIVTAVFALIAIALLVQWSIRRPHPPASDAPHVAPIQDGRFRILVVADGPCSTPHFGAELRSHAEGLPDSVSVVAPTLESKLGLLTEDQRGYDEASQRLETTLAALEDAGLEAHGQVGPPDPLQAADDGLREFAANEIVFVTHPEARTNWLEEGVVAMAESRYFQPVRHVDLVTG